MTHPATIAVLRQAAAVLIDHPGERLYATLDVVAAALRDVALDAPGPAADLLAVHDHLAATPPLAAAGHHVDTFDLRRRTSLHLTWYTDGDTRRRGASLAALKTALTGAGWRITGGELPDHLGVLLEFAARGDAATGHRLLCELRPSIDVLHAALTEDGSVYARALAAVVATLPAPSADTESAWRRLARNGPPSEDVGLDGYGHGTPLGMPSVRADSRPGRGSRRRARMETVPR